jgi:hypothetical protein
MNLDEKIRLNGFAAVFLNYFEQFYQSYLPEKEFYIDIIKDSNFVWENSILTLLEESDESKYLASRIKEGLEKYLETEIKPEADYHNPTEEDIIAFSIKSELAPVLKSNLNHYLEVLTAFLPNEQIQTTFESDYHLGKNEVLTKNQKTILLDYLNKTDHLKLRTLHQDTKSQASILGPLLNISSQNLARTLGQNQDQFKAQNNNLIKVWEIVKDLDDDFHKLKELVEADLKKFDIEF